MYTPAVNGLDNAWLTNNCFAAQVVPIAGLNPYAAAG